MSNNYFKFKKFTIYQDKCAMKVCTDACLFGAFLPKVDNDVNRVLDIGIGTGLLSLMFAQKNESILIDSIEIDCNAFKQATENINNTVWKQNIKVILGDIKSYQTIELYDIIFSNPPFFTNDFKSHTTERNVAMHCNMLSFDELLKTVKRLLKNNGLFYVLLPFSNENIFLKTAKKYQLFATQIKRVRQTPSHNFFRSMIVFETTEKDTLETEITIKQGADYTAEFTNLLKEYYLFM